MTTTAGHSFYIGPVVFFYYQVNDTGSWEPLVIYCYLFSVFFCVQYNMLFSSWVNMQCNCISKPMGKCYFCMHFILLENVIILSILIWHPVFGIQIKEYLNNNQI
jgi:hypothetical protein